MNRYLKYSSHASNNVKLILQSLAHLRANHPWKNLCNPLRWAAPSTDHFVHLNLWTLCELVVDSTIRVRSPARKLNTTCSQSCSSSMITSKQIWGQSIWQSAQQTLLQNRSGWQFWAFGGQQYANSYSSVPPLEFVTLESTCCLCYEHQWRRQCPTNHDGCGKTLFWQYIIREFPLGKKSTVQQFLSLRSIHYIHYNHFNVKDTNRHDQACDAHSKGKTTPSASN